MKASNVLDNLCMEKVASRTYRDKIGNKISAQEWKDLHGGTSYQLKNGEKIDRVNLGLGLLQFTGDGKYKVRDASDKRTNILRAGYALNNSNEKDAIKALNHNSSFGNTLNTKNHNTGKPLSYLKSDKAQKVKSKKFNNKRNLPSGIIPEVILGAGLLSAAGAKIYNDINKKKAEKKEGEKHERKQHTR